MDHFDDDFRRQQNEGGNTSRNVVRYDEYPSGALDWLSPVGSRSDRSRTTRNRRNKERWSPSLSSASTSAVQPRAEFSFPLHWKNTPETTNATSSSSSWPVLSWDHQRRSRITASTTLPLYQSQDALMDYYPSSSYDDNSNHIKKRVAVERKKYHRREILCKLSMTTLQYHFFQPEDVVVFGSLSLMATQYHNNNNDDDDNDREKTSLILTAHRQQTDVLTLSLDHQGGERYAISAILTTTSAEGNNREESSSPPHLRLRAHWNNNLIFHRSRGPMMVQIRPDISMTGSSSQSSPSSSLFTIDPEVGISILHQDWRHNHMDSRTQHAARSLGHVRFSCIYTDQSWKPSVRLHWSYPFWGSFYWQQQGGASSTAIQYDALWKSANHHRSNFQLSVATHDIFNAVAWKWIISFTLSDVTIRFPIIIGAANTWQLHMVHWGLASVVSHLVTYIVQDFLQQQRRNKQSHMDSNASRKGDRRRTALMQQHFMERQAILRYRDEVSRNGLLIDNAMYRYKEVSLDVTIPLRFWVTDSKLELFADQQRPLMLGFYNLVEDSHEENQTTSGDDDNGNFSSKRSFAEMIKSIVVQGFTVIPAKTVSSTDYVAARNNQNVGSSILEICYRFHGTRYTISLGDDEHVVLPCPRAKLITD